jgi:hypothetical protein
MHHTVLSCSVSLVLAPSTQEPCLLALVTPAPKFAVASSRAAPSRATSVTAAATAYSSPPASPSAVGLPQAGLLQRWQATVAPLLLEARLREALLQAAGPQSDATSSLPQPRLFGVLPLLPQTPAGKVDRLAVAQVCLALLASVNPHAAAADTVVTHSCHVSSGAVSRTIDGIMEAAARASSTEETDCKQAPLEPRLTVSAAISASAVASEVVSGAACSEVAVMHVCAHVLHSCLQGGPCTLEPCTNLMALGATSLDIAAIAMMLGTQPPIVYTASTPRRLARALQVATAGDSRGCVWSAVDQSKQVAQRLPLAIYDGSAVKRARTGSPEAADPLMRQGQPPARTSHGGACKDAGEVASLKWRRDEAHEGMHLDKTRVALLRCKDRASLAAAAHPRHRTRAPPPRLAAAAGASCGGVAVVLCATDSRGESLTAFVSSKLEPVLLPPVHREPTSADPVDMPLLTKFPPPDRNPGSHPTRRLAQLAACVDAAVTLMEYRCQRACTCPARVWVVACSHAGDVACVDMCTGGRAWTTQLQSSPSGGAQVTVCGQGAAVALLDGRVALLRLCDGAALCAVATGGQLRRCCISTAELPIVPVDEVASGGLRTSRIVLKLENNPCRSECGLAH